MDSPYLQAAALHRQAAPFRASIPPQFLPHIAFVLLATAFLLSFYFTTLPKRTLTGSEIGVGLVASVSTGFGVVALFNAVGVYV